MVALLAAHPNQVSVNDVRNKINEILNEGIGGAVTTDPNPPSGTASDGDLWFDETSAILYVYTDSVNGWVQTNGGGGGGGGTPGGADNEVQFNDNGSFAGSSTFTYDGNTVTVPRLHVLPDPNATASGNEGGEIALQKATNSTLNGGIILDMYIDSLRIFEGASPFKGAYLDLNECGNYLNGTQTNLLSGGGGGGSNVFAQGFIDLNGNVTKSRNIASASIVGTSGDAYRTITVNLQNGPSSDHASYNVQLAVRTTSEGNDTAAILTYRWASSTQILVRANGFNVPNNFDGISILVLDNEGGAGPRAYVTFDGTSSNLTSSIFNSFNVSSITDNNVGDYTINYQNQVPTPVVTAMVGEDITNQTDLANQNINLYDATNSSIRVRINQDSAGYSAGARDKGYVSVVVH